MKEPEYESFAEFFRNMLIAAAIVLAGLIAIRIWVGK
jgi:hypothetical protein